MTAHTMLWLRMRLTPGALCLAAVVLAAGSARAQIGADEAAFRKAWGEPVSSTAAADGTRTLNFQTNDVSISAVVLEGAVQRIAYQRDGMTDGEVNRLMALNGHGASWGLFRDTGTGSGLRQVVWIRSDEGAMSVFEADTVTITTGRWMQWSSQAAQAPAVAPAAAPEAEVAAADEADPVGELAGIWQADAADGVAAIVCGRDGSCAWHGMAEYGVRELRARVESMGSERPLRFEIWRVARDREPLGMAVLQEDGTLTFARRQGAAATGFWPVDRHGELIYRRVSQMPRWESAKPGDLPAMGDTRNRVLAQFGKPKGQMSVGREEIFSYPWGQVVLETGRVVRVKAKAAAR